MTAQLSYRPLHRLLPIVALLASIVLPARADVPPVLDQPYPGTIVLKVDATNLSQQIFRMQMSIPVKPGPLTMLYPQWLPGNHGPSGPLTQLAGLKFSGNGKPIGWVRDPVQVHAFHLTVPAGVSTVEAEYQFLSPLDTAQGRITMTNDILGVQWPSVTLYPAGYSSRRITVQPSLILPEGWQYGSALETAARSGNEIVFKPLDLETLIDSPLFAGRHFKRIDLDPGAKVPVFLNIVADNLESLEAKPEQIEPHRAMVRQAAKLFGSHHYNHYDFLFALSDDFGGIGREHHQSSENGVKPGYFTEWAKGEAGRDLLAHEYVHSWDGKFRRPAGQDVPNFNVPLKNELLWVYEGQTQYWGKVLSARSGLISETGTRDGIAAAAAFYDNVQGRSWRAVQDTVNDPIINMRRPQGWSNWQRSEDYYVEGMFIWLDVDTKIREMSNETRSLDDFARAFYGVNNGSFVPVFYTFEDVVAALNRVQPFDWAPFLRSRLDGHASGAPLDGLARAGWKLVYNDTPSDYSKSVDEQRKSTDFSYSLGMAVKLDGGVAAVQWDGVAFRAGLAGNSTIVAVNNRAYKGEVLKAAVKAAKESKAPIALLVKQGANYRTIALDYHGGLRYPHLERIPASRDRLATILKPLK
ncbi:M61 family metallopeptidase [Massilia psychrophila]|uniref:Peptidase M61 n=1 Tax=Massilia psychrophila TaxID=1603353 RepID=A0A2G8T1C9_9BURK|nr:M61 family metallopeptidase [Massilia psychrophila]PIL39814.1 peptidase M61 [Massilia psychrophila]GGE62996.1 peptidase M61 [Massilia psychrophila]